MAAEEDGTTKHKVQQHKVKQFSHYVLALLPMEDGLSFLDNKTSLELNSIAAFS